MIPGCRQHHDHRVLTLAVIVLQHQVAANEQGECRTITVNL